MKRIIISVLFVFIFSNNTKAQDPIFTQSLLIPQTLNPSFSGFLDSTTGGLIHRIQWPNESKELNTSFGFIECNLSDNWGGKLTILRQHEVFTDYNLYLINAGASYKIDIGGNILSFGLEGGYGDKNLNFDNLILEDQINTNDGTINPISNDPFIKNNLDRVQYLDISAGVLFNTNNSWFGVTLRHLNTPNITLNQNGFARLDIFTSVHAKFFANDHFLSFLPDDSFIAFNFMKQSQYNRLDAGIQSTIAKNKLTGGILLATNPIRKTENSYFLTSVNPFVNFIFNVNRPQFKVGVSYDINTTKFLNNKGIFEFSITCILDPDCKECRLYN